MPRLEAYRIVERAGYKVTTFNPSLTMRCILIHSRTYEVVAKSAAKMVTSNDGYAVCK